MKKQTAIWSLVVGLLVAAPAPAAEMSRLSEKIWQERCERIVASLDARADGLKFPERFALHNGGYSVEEVEKICVRMAEESDNDEDAPQLPRLGPYSRGWDAHMRKGIKRIRELELEASRVPMPRERPRR
jgi:hypothetical protein